MTFSVYEVRTGRILSTHRTEALAFAALDLRERRTARKLNRPGLMGGTGWVELAVLVDRPG